MRILHVGKFYPPHAGGVERHVFDLAESQAGHGLEVACLVHATPGPSRGAGTPAASRVRVQRVPCHGQLLFAPISPTWPWHLHRMLREFRPDLMHVHVPNPSAFWSLLQPAARRIPTIVHWHADVPEDSGHRGVRLAYPMYRRFERALNAHAERIVATSQIYLDASRALSGFRSRCEVIPLGIGDAMPPGRAPVWPHGDLKLLAVGRLSYYKGFDVLLDAVAATPGVSLVIVGEGERRRSLEQQVDALGLHDCVSFAGHLDDRDLESAYRACDVFCLPSLDRAEAFGIVLLEAMRAAKPIVASAIPGSGVGSVVVDGATGVLVPPGDSASLSRALKQLLDAPQQREAMGRAGAERWTSDYRIDAVTPRWIRTYREILDLPTAS